MCIIDLRCSSVCISILAIQSHCQTCPTTLPRWQTTRTKKFVLALPNLPTTPSSSCPPDSPPPRLASRSQSASLPTPKSAPAVKTRNTYRENQNNLLAAHRRTWYRTSYSSPWTSDSPTAFKILTPSSSTSHQHGQFQKRKKKKSKKMSTIQYVHPSLSISLSVSGNPAIALPVSTSSNGSSLASR